jgi:hypothetical protein
MSGCGRLICKAPCSPSGRAATVTSMLIAGLICSDEDCAAEADVLALHADDLDAAACACGCTQVVLSLSEWTRPQTPARLLAAA